MNNPPAFPTGTGVTPYNAGMTLRDYFAAQALQGAISGCAARGEIVMYSDLAGLSYEMADAMLKARKE
jgi:hypothetical protein